VLIGAEDVTNHKPHPEPLLRALAQLGAPPAQALYVGDSTHDIAAARAAQMSVAAAAWGPFPRHELVSLAPDFLLDDPSDLLSICSARVKQR
jgi:pyrophosphatase PpaX